MNWETITVAITALLSGFACGWLTLRELTLRAFARNPNAVIALFYRELIRRRKP